MSEDGNDNVYDLSKLKAVKAAEKPKGSSGLFEIHMLPEGLETAKGYLKFGPGFTAIVEGPEDESPVTFAVVTSAVKYIKRIDEDGTVQGTLSV